MIATRPTYDCPRCNAEVRIGRQRRTVCFACGSSLLVSHDVGVARESPRASGLSLKLDEQSDAFLGKLRDAFSSVDVVPAGALSGLGGASGDGLDSGLTMGDRIPGFEIIRELGRGGMGVVYHARQQTLGRDVALKVLPNVGRYGDEAIARFTAEAKAAAKLHHTNIVSVYAHGQFEGLHYYAMALIDGTSVDRVMADDRASLLGPRECGSRAVGYRRFARRVAEVADALACAHRQGVVHRDVKPHNLLLDNAGRLHLVDFGLAMLAEQPSLTQTGDMMGTMAYLSPEQIQARRDGIDHRTDIYALGVTLYEMLSGRQPFVGETRAQVLRAILKDEPTRPRLVDASIPADLETICLRAMRKAPEDRFATAEDFAEDLRRFADCRVIRSRRPGVVDRALKWTRRHKSASVALGLAAVLAVTMTVSLLAAATTRAERHARLIGRVYEQLAFVNYRDVDKLTDDLRGIERIANGNPEAQRVLGLADIAIGDPDEAIAHLKDALQVMPDDRATRYLLSWAYWKAGELDRSKAVFAESESLAVPESADSLFFRGLAAHRAEPDVAVDSYRQASRLRTQGHGFYPQAVLHLARARNQQMYKQRSLDFFHEADVTLRQLIEHEAYDSYPYYLLSITHRLAAEIYRGSEGTRDDGLVEDHFAEALRLARAGQDVEPDNDRPVTAEAECLESMGRFKEAIAARTRAIGLSNKPVATWESLHYRWRLHFWIGDHESAMNDLARCAEFDPGNRFYEAVYPALVLADRGMMAEAVASVRSLINRGDTSSMDALWSATTLRLLGQSAEAERVLGDISPGSGADQWISLLHGMMTGARDLEDVASFAASSPSPWQLLGEAHFHDAARRLSLGERSEALDSFRKAYRSFDSEQRYTYHTKMILKRMEQNALWPSMDSQGL